MKIADVYAREVTLDQRLRGSAVDDIRLDHLIRRVIGAHRQRPPREIGRQLAGDAPRFAPAATHEDRPRGAIRRTAVLVHEWQQQNFFTHGRVRSPFSTAFFATRPAPIITEGLEVFVQLVMAAITTEPWCTSPPSSRLTPGSRAGSTVASGSS